MFEFLRYLLYRWRFTKLEHLDFVIYSRENCSLCDRAWAEITSWQRRYRFKLRMVDVDDDPTLQELYGNHVPVVTVNGKQRFRGHVNSVLLRRLLVAEADKHLRMRGRK